MGLIPAHAGKTTTVYRDGIKAAAHPRSRGENRGLASAQAGLGGSSPLTRGKHTRAVQVVDHQRLIPAHAGKTSPGLHLAGEGRAHPRSRGENRAGDDLPPARPGSSPLTRGKLQRSQCDRDAVGLIPAHAGKTSHTRTKD